ncbi:uncharacterized protein LOC122505586 isoform X2 [Leptopilina heterotoma]|nr:uncharacterized protein LOC122505586 isoform X2 [Leptopilina heterotoma]
MFKTLFTHRILKSGDGYFCKLCKMYIKQNDVLSHCDSKNEYHWKLKELQVDIPERELKTVTEEKFETIVENKIFQINNEKYFCKVCNCVIARSLYNVFQHIRGLRHKLNQKEKENLRLDKADAQKSVLPPKKNASSLNNNLVSQSPSQFICFVCNKNFTRKEAMAEHILKSKGECKISSLLLLKQLNDDSLKYHCTLCDVDIPYGPQNLVEHTQGKRHRVSVQDFENNANNLQTMPKTIPKTIPKNDSVDQVQKSLDKLHLAPKAIEEKFKCSYRCYVCNVTVCGDVELLAHLQDIKHKHILSTLPRDYSPFIYCPACKKDIFEDNKMINHLGSVEHKQHLRSISNKSSSPSNLENVPATKTIVEELCNQMIRKQRKPKEENKKENRNSHFFNNEYRRKFLELGPFNIYKTPQEKINYLQLGTTLLFTVEEEILCLVCFLKIPNCLQNIFEHVFNVNHINKLEKLIDSDLKFKNCPNQFSDLALAKEFMKEFSNDCAFCFACNKDVVNDEKKIRKHISEANHSVKSKSQRQFNFDLCSKFLEQLNNCWYVVQRFSCHLCGMKSEFEIDFSEHLLSNKHLTKRNKVLEKGDKVAFDVCFPCASICFGTCDTYTMHCDHKMHKYFVKSKDYEVVKMNRFAVNLLHDFQEVSESLLRQSDAETESEEKILLLSKSVEQTVSSKYPGAKAYVFGSRTAHLAFSNSDVDIFLDCGNAYKGKLLLSASREYLLNSEVCFKNSPYMWDVKEILLKVRAPIIKLFHRDLELNCDLSFTNGITVEKTRIIKLFVTSLPLCRKAILFLKKWLSACYLTHEQGLTTFGITWLVVFYLQQINVFPSIAELMKGKSQSFIIGDWETGIASQIPVRPSSLTFESLLKGFLKFYAQYDYRTCIISPLMGKSLKKIDFIDDRVQHLPKEMECYTRYIKSTLNAETFRIDSPLCLQDPIDLAQNITRSVSKLVLRSFIQYCQEGGEILNSLDSEVP